MQDENHAAPPPPPAPPAPPAPIPSPASPPPSVTKTDRAIFLGVALVTLIVGLATGGAIGVEDLRQPRIVSYLFYAVSIGAILVPILGSIVTVQGSAYGATYQIVGAGGVVAVLLGGAYVLGIRDWQCPWVGCSTAAGKLFITLQNEKLNYQLEPISAADVDFNNGTMLVQPIVANYYELNLSPSAAPYIYLPVNKITRAGHRITFLIFPLSNRDIGDLGLVGKATAGADKRVVVRFSETLRTCELAK